jgi:DNA repair protein RadC
MSASLIRLVKELYCTYLAENMKKHDVLSSPDAVINFSRVMLSGLSNEVFMAIYINVKNEVIDYALLQEGTLDNVAVYPRRIIESALSLVMPQGLYSCTIILAAIPHHQRKINFSQRKLQMLPSHWILEYWTI